MAFRHTRMPRNEDGRAAKCAPLGRDGQDVQYGACRMPDAHNKQDIIVIGASAGGIEALKTLVAGLPRNLAAAVFVVQHIPPWRTSELPEILSRAGNLPALHPQEGEQIETGRIYIAPPDRHLLVENNSRVGLWHGPKEN